MIVLLLGIVVLDIVLELGCVEDEVGITPNSQPVNANKLNNAIIFLFFIIFPPF